VNRKYRLTRTSDIQRVRRSGKSCAHPLLVLITEEVSEGQNFQVAFLASKSLGGAVQRNRAKRRLRAAFEQVHKDIRPGIHLLIVARIGILGASFSDIQQAMEQCLRKARVSNPHDTTNNDPV
jgi:ribonuclease P protein component